MAEINIPEILIQDYNLYNFPRTWFNKTNAEDGKVTYKIANRFGNTNCLVKIDPAVLIEANS